MISKFLTRSNIYYVNIFFIVIFYVISIKNGYLEILNNKILMSLDTVILICVYILVFSINMLFMNKYSLFLKPENRYEKIFLGLIILCITLYFLICICPIRDADAIRYKATMIKQASLDGKFQFYPYFCFNLQQLWSWGVYPLYYTLGDTSLLLFTFAMYLLYTQIACIYCLNSDLTDNSTPQQQQNKIFFLLALLVSSPVILLVTTTVGNDTFLIYLISIACLIILKRENNNFRWFYLSAAIIGIASSAKIQAILYLFILCFYISFIVKIKGRNKIIKILFTVLLIFSIFFSPVSLWNFLSHGEPFYPILVTNNKGYFYTMTNNFMRSSLQGTFSLHNIFCSVWKLMTWWQWNYITSILLIFIVIYYRKSVFKHNWFVFAVLYGVLLILSNPSIYPRYYLFGYILLLPVLSRLIINVDFINRKIRYLYFMMGLLGAIGTVVYSYDHLHYLFTKDADNYHKYTWYYDVSKKINKLLTHNDHLLIINQSEQNYYIDAPFLSADKPLSALINWDSNNDELLKIVESYGFTYIFFDESAIDNSMKEKINFLLNSLSSEKIFEEKIRLYFGRLFRSYSETKVYLYRIYTNSHNFTGYKERAYKLKEYSGLKHEINFN